MPVAAGTKRKRGEGQWALGYREPLNKNEENKKNDDGLNVRQRIIDIYSKHGFDSIDPADLRGRFRWYGLYTQRRPGHRRRQDRDPGAGGARRPLLHAARPDRRRPAEPSTQLRAIADISTEYGRGTADVTDRQNIQLHWIEIEDVPDIWERLGGGRACPPPRPAATPRASSSAARWPASTPTRCIDATPEIAEHQRAVHRRPGVLQPAAQVQVRDQRLPGAVHHPRDQRHRVRRRRQRPDGETGYDLWVGGGLSTNPMFGKRLGAFVRPEPGRRGLGRA